MPLVFVTSSSHSTIE